MASPPNPRIGGRAVRQWLWAIGIGLAASAPVHAGSGSANLAVSVTVADRCMIHTDSRSVSCAGGSAYALGVGRERIALASGQLTVGSEHAHTIEDGPHLGVSRSAAGADGRQGTALADGAVRTAAEAVAPVDAIRVTYSF